jgi:predicted Zn-dependent protease
METTPFDLVVPGEAYRVLLYAAMLGTELGEASLASDIAQALIELRPDLPHAEIVLAMNEFSAGHYDQAMGRLEEVLEKFPNSQLGRAMLGTFMKTTGRVGWEALMEAVIDDGRDECAVGLACAMLGRTNAGEPATQDYANTFSAPPPAHAMWA